MPLTDLDLHVETYEHPDGWVSLPMEVSHMFSNGMGPLKSWRKYLKLTQTELAERMGITRDRYKHYEASEKPRRDTLTRAAEAMGLNPRQLIEMYDDEPVGVPVGYVPPSPEELD